MRGPADTTIHYESDMNMNYDFRVIKYNWMVCSITADTLNAIIISLVCVLVGGALVAYISVLIYKKVRYNRLMREAARR